VFLASSASGIVDTDRAWLVCATPRGGAVFVFARQFGVTLIIYKKRWFLRVTLPLNVQGSEMVCGVRRISVLPLVLNPRRPFYSLYWLLQAPAFVSW